jgi:hypothetical protein
LRAWSSCPDHCVCALATTRRRDTRALLAAGKDAEAQGFIAENAHPRLWRLLAEHALERLDLVTAEKGFVQCRDFHGVQLVRRIGQLGDKDKQQAEVGVGWAGCIRSVLRGLVGGSLTPDLALAQQEPAAALHTCNSPT